MMSLASICRAFALAVCFLSLLQAPGLAQEAPPSSSGGVGAEAEKTTEAQALMESGRYLEAVQILGPLVQGRIIHANTLFLYGRAALEASQQPGVPDNTRSSLLDQAISAFHAMLVKAPGLVRVRLELARAFFLKGEDTLARRHFEQVLAGRPPPAVVANVVRFLRSMRARRRWQARFGFAVAPDSNLNTASGTRTIYLDVFGQRLPFTLDDASSRKSGIGVSIWGGGEYQYPLGPSGPQAMPGPWRLRAGADASMRDYKGGDFDRHSLSAYLGPRRLIDARTEASLLATVERQWTAGLPETDRFGLRLEGRHRLTPRLALDGRASAARRNCRDCNHLDGPVGDVSVSASWAALPILRVGGNAGWSWARANDEHWRSDGPQAGLGATLALPVGFTLGLRASLRRTEYQGRGSPHRTIDRKPRKDETHTLSLSVHNRAVTVLGFSPRLSLIREERDTNAQTLDYKRNRAELSFVQQF